MSVSWECCVLSGRGLCDRLIPRLEESYGWLSVVNVVCCEVEVSTTGRSLLQSSPMDVCLLWVLCVCHVEVSATGWSLVQRSPMNDCLMWVLCVVTLGSLRQADPSSRGVLWIFICCKYCECCQVEISASGWSLLQKNPTDLVCLSVIVKPR
jgi:hypothetical protein